MWGDGTGVRAAFRSLSEVDLDRRSSVRSWGYAHGALACVVALFSLHLVGCAGRRAPTVPVNVQATAKVDGLNQKLSEHVAAVEEGQDYSIGPEDLLEVSLFDIEEDEGGTRRIPVRVNASGLISLPLVGRVDVAGLTVIEIENLLRDRYRKFIHEPQVTVFVKEYRSYRISVVGHVAKPGLYEVTGRKTLLEVLGLAGGLSKEAGMTVQVTRRLPDGLATREVDLTSLLDRGDLTQNILLEPGDVVTVPKAQVFFVVGSVKRPGAYPIRRPLTATQALATAGGADERLARVGGTKLFRQRADGERVEIPLDIAAIRKGRVEDPRIGENDILVIPMNRLKYVAEMLLGRIGVGFSPAF